jgi:hypothetical protein
VFIAVAFFVARDVVRRYYHGDFHLRIMVHWWVHLIYAQKDHTADFRDTRMLKSTAAVISYTEFHLN